jgi:MYXO-CTERM domain-containing protein
MRRFIMLTALVIAPAAPAQTIGFEDVTVPTPPGYVNGSTGPGGNTQFTSGGATFNNFYNPTFGNWAGWAVSRVTDTTTQGFGNQYAAYNVPSGTGDNSPTYAVGYVDAFNAVNPTIQLPPGTRPQAVRITNDTYPALIMLNGDPNNFARQFDVAHQDYFKLTVQGRDALGALTGSVDFFLADYRVPSVVSSPYVISQWTTVNLAQLGNAATLTFSLDSSDVGQFGINTPTYFAMDNLTVTPVPEPGTLALAALAATALWRRRRSALGGTP